MHLRPLALSAVLAASATALVAPPAHASTRVCSGGEIVRCVEVVWNQATNKFYAHGWIVDAAGGPNVSVAVTDVRLQRYDGSYTTVRQIQDGDGYFDVRDDATTEEMNPCHHPGNSYMAMATFLWKGDRTGTDTFRSTPMGMGC